MPFHKNPFYVNMRWINRSSLNKVGEKRIMEGPRHEIEQDLLMKIGQDLGFAAVKEREIYDRLDKKDNFFARIEGFFTSIFSSLAISMISACILFLSYKTACCCFMIKKCKRKTENDMELENLERTNEKIQNLVERIAALESESASVMSLEEDEKKYQQAKRDEQEEFNTSTTDSIQNMLFIMAGLLRSVGMRTKARDIIKKQIDENFTDKLEVTMRSWKQYELEYDQSKVSDKKRYIIKSLS